MEIKRKKQIEKMKKIEKQERNEKFSGKSGKNISKSDLPDFPGKPGNVENSVHFKGKIREMENSEINDFSTENSGKNNYFKQDVINLLDMPRSTIEKNPDLRIVKRQIKDVGAGEYVLSLNEFTGEIVSNKVIELLDMGEKPVYELMTDSGRSINTTSTHPYLVKVNNKNKCDALAGNVWNKEYDDFEEEKGYCTRWVSVSELQESDEIAVQSSFDNFLESSFVEIQNPNLNNLFSYVQRGDFSDKDNAIKSLSFVCSFNNFSAFGIKEIYSFSGTNSILLDINENNNLNFSLDNLDFDNISCLLLRNSSFSFDGAINFNFLLNIISNISPEEINVLNNTFASSITFIYLIDNLTLEDSSSASCSVNEDFDTISFAIDKCNSWINESITFSNAEVNSSLNSIGMSNFILISSMSENKESKYINLSKNQQNKESKHLKFEKIISIEQVGIQHVYDLAIENTHNFIANDIVAHNTYVGCVNLTGDLVPYTGADKNVDLGSNKLTVSGDADITGNLGIGATSPQNKLDVIGDCSFEKDEISIQNSYESRNSFNSSVLNILTNDCSLKCLSFDQIGILSSNANATNGISVLCEINSFDFDKENCDGLFKFINSDNNFEWNKKDCLEILDLEQITFEYLFNSSIVSFGANNSTLCSFNNLFVNELDLNKEKSMFVSTTNLIYYSSYFLEINSFNSLPNFMQSSSVNSELATSFSSFSNASNCPIFFTNASLANADQLSQANFSISFLTSAGIDKVIDVILFNMCKHDLYVFKTFGFNDRVIFGEIEINIGNFIKKFIKIKLEKAKKYGNRENSMHFKRKKQEMKNAL